MGRLRHAGLVVLVALTIAPAPLTHAAPAQGADAEEQLTVRSSLVEVGAPWLAWLGGTPRRELVLRVANSGTTVVDDAVLSLSVAPTGRPADPAGSFSLGTFAVGDVKELRVPVDLPVLAFGTYDVTGEISGTTTPIVVTERTSSFPWLLILGPALLVLRLVLDPVRHVLRGRTVLPRPEPDGPDLTRAHPTQDAEAGAPRTALGAVGAVDRDAEADEPPAHPSGLVYVVELDELDDVPAFVDPAVADRILHEDHQDGHGVYTVVGSWAARRLLIRLVAPPDLGAAPAVVRAVTLPPVLGVPPGDAEEAGTAIAAWIPSHLDLPADTAVCVEWGIPSVTYRLVIDATDDEVASLAGELRSDGIHATCGAAGDERALRVRVHDLPTLQRIVRQVSARMAIVGHGAVGLVPLALVERAGPDVLRELGLSSDDTFEHRILAAADAIAIDVVPPPREPVLAAHAP